MVDSTRQPTKQPPADNDRAYLRGYINNVVREINDADRKEILEHIDGKFNELKSTMLSAFPGNDPVGHRAYHQKQIEFMEERTKLYRELRSKTLVALLWVVILFVASALWEQIRVILLTGKPLP